MPTPEPKEVTMLHWALTFLVLALVGDRRWSSVARHGATQVHSPSVSVRFIYFT